MTYECTPESVVTVPADRSISGKDETKVSNQTRENCASLHITLRLIICAVVKKIPGLYNHFHDFSMTYVIFHHFPGEWSFYIL